MKILELHSYVNNKSRKNLWISDQIFGFAENSLCLMYLLTEFGRSVRENLAQGKRLIIIFRYSVILDHVIYLSNTSWCTLSLLWQHWGCETNNAHLQKFNCPCPPPTSRQWTYVIQGREYKGHTRPKRPFRTEIYYMGVVKNRELKWSFVGALEITSKLPPAEYFRLATCRTCTLAILAQTQGSGYWQLNHWNRLTSETSSLLDSTLLIHHN